MTWHILVGSKQISEYNFSGKKHFYPNITRNTNRKANIFSQIEYFGPVESSKRRMSLWSDFNARFLRRQLQVKIEWFLVLEKYIYYYSVNSV